MRLLSPKSIPMLLLMIFVAVAITPVIASADQAVAALQIENSDSFAATNLIGRDARLQLLVSARMQNGDTIDWTHQCRYETEPSGIVEISADGLVTPLADGNVTVVAISNSGVKAQTKLTVSRFGVHVPVSFPGQIVPIFTKLSCNSGGCHGKAAGQNGFRLSLLGFGPKEDFDHLVKESRGRRLSIASPDQSLLLLKAINESPHGGGARLKKDSHEYRLIRRWIAQGMPYGPSDAPTVESIDVFPKQRRIATGGSQQLSVLAKYSDGRTEDITRAAVFESNDTEMADVDLNGRVQLAGLVGDVAVMARYQGQVTVFRADLPLGATDHWKDSDWPTAKNVIDTAVYAKLRSLGIPPSAPCDDATFLRRVTLDIAGRLPTLDEVTEFNANDSDSKRDALIDRLLDSEDYAEYFGRKWNTILRNKRSGGTLDFRTATFHRWIRSSLRENKRYDEFVREIVTASGSVASCPPVAWLHQVPDTNQRIEDTAQLFLGQRIQCARCHHHPYEKWSQGDYAQMTAFFSLMQKKVGGEPTEPMFVARVGNPSGRHPRTGQGLKPAGLDGDDLNVGQNDDPREHLADWMTDPANPFFARSLANRYWKHFMGRGLVEPEDDMRVTNPPSNPELLDAMATAFVESSYDLKALIRLICQSQTYHSQSDAIADNLQDRRSYSRFYPKRLQAETLLDAVDRVTLSETRFKGMPTGVRAVALPDTGFDSYFLNVFGQPNSVSACECERTQEANLAQSLHLLNSDEMQKKLATDNGRAAKLAADTHRSDEEKVKELYLVALSRQPRPNELKATIDYLGRKENRREAFEDVVWSVVNSKEFLFNH